MRHGNIRLANSSEDERFFSDDSVANGNKVGVLDKPNYGNRFVDAMNDRRNDTDMRLMTNAVTEKDFEGGVPLKRNGGFGLYTNERKLKNQPFERKVKFNAKVDDSSKVNNNSTILQTD